MGRIGVLEDTHKNIEEVQAELANNAGKLNGLEILSKVISITAQARQSLVTIQDFQNVKNELANMQLFVNELKSQQDETAQQLTDDHYQVIKDSHDVQELNLAKEKMEQDLD